MEELGVSESYAYKLIHRWNRELAGTGCVLIASEFNMDNIRAKFNSMDELKIEHIRCLLK